MDRGVDWYWENSTSTAEYRRQDLELTAWNLILDNEKTLEILEKYEKSHRNGYLQFSNQSLDSCKRS